MNISYNFFGYMCIYRPTVIGQCRLWVVLPYIHLKVFFGHLVRTLAFFHVKNVHFFGSHDTIFSTLNMNP